MCEICFDLEWTIIMHLYRNRVGRKKMHVIYALKLRLKDTFPRGLFSCQPGTPVVNISNVLNIKKVEK